MSLTEEAKMMLRQLPHLNTNPELGGFPFYKWMRKYYQSAAGINLLTSANQVGKMLPLDELVPTIDGFRKVSEIKVGDVLYGSDGKPTKVIAIPYEGTRPCYKIIFDDKSEVVAGREHKWICQTERNRFRKTIQGGNSRPSYVNKHFGKWQVLETHEIISLAGYGSGKVRAGKKVVIPVCKGVEYPEKDLLIDPYVMGAMIGDGDCASMTFGCGDPEMTKRVVTGKISWVKSKKNYSYGKVHFNDGFSHYSCRGKALAKRIHPDFLAGSKDQRLELLKGLMDTDGSVYRKGTLEYATISPGLKDDFIELINSLGGIINKVSIKKAWYYSDKRERVYCNDAYSIRFKIQVNPFWIKRKADKFRGEIRYRHQRIIESIEYVGELKGRCFTVDNSDHSFLCTKNYIVTHNSSINIRKMINWATNPGIWSKLWPNNHHNVAQFWYLYPTLDVATIEFVKKWEVEWMPRGEMKDHPQYGWKAEFERKKIKAIHFNTGVSCYFKSYAQNSTDLQSGSCFTAGHEIMCQNGIKKIEDVSVGDFVLTRNGFKEVEETFELPNREVIKRGKFEATPNHRFFTLNRGWVAFGALTSDDVVVRTAIWKILKSLYCLKASFTGENQKAKTSGNETILGRLKERVCTLLSGKITQGKSTLEKVGTFIISTLIHLITNLITLSSLPLEHTTLFTKKKNGKRRATLITIANAVERALGLGALKNLSLDIAPKYAEKNPTLKVLCAKIVAKLLLLEKMRLPDFAVRSVQTVFDIRVKDNHEYFCNGNLVHNCHAIFADEELPIHLFDELKFRTSATDGQFHMVFTATLGQYEWECAMEKIGEPEELFKRDSCKIQVSLYDCLEYEDGSKTPWTRERIQKRIDSCSSEAEVQKRIFGRFVQTGAFKYNQFLSEDNLLDKWVFNPKYHIYSATDPGSGGKKGHPTGISFLAVSPDYTEGVIFMGWRGDGVTTTQADALAQYIRVRGKLNVSSQYYDYHARDFYTIAERKGEVFEMAEKSHEIGEPILKSLLKFNALKIVTGELLEMEPYQCEFEQGELLKLLSEFRTLKDETDKRSAKDDLIDTVRYNCAKVPWDWEKIMGEKKKVVQKHIPKTDAERIKERRGSDDTLKDMNDDYEQEIGFWNDCYDHE